MKPRKSILLTLVILVFITTVFWIFFSVYRVFTTKLPSTTPAEILAPIDPHLDKNTIVSLTEKLYISQ